MRFRFVAFKRQLSLWFNDTNLTEQRACHTRPGVAKSFYGFDLLRLERCDAHHASHPTPIIWRLLPTARF
jgi:hypothetical protein